jgi:hypothetical protein
MAHHPKQTIDINGKTWDRDAIIALLLTSDYAVERAILKLYERQTESEKQVGVTTQKNGIGFSGFDGDIFSSFAQQILKSERKPGQRLSPRQLACARKPIRNGIPRIGCYAGQLLSEIQTMPVAA